MNNEENFTITEKQMKQFIEMRKYLENKIYSHSTSIRILKQKDGNPRTIEALRKDIKEIANILNVDACNYLD